jgi:hypothetical protein
VFTQFDIVNVGRRAGVEDKYELMLRSVQSHTAIVFGPYADVFQICVGGIDRPANRHKLYDIDAAFARLVFRLRLREKYTPIARTILAKSPLLLRGIF